MHWFRKTEDSGRQSASAAGKKPAKRRLKWLIAALLLFLLAGGVARLLLPSFARDYVNRTLDRNPLYAGEIGDVTLHLRRGAYSIEEVRINKVTGNVPVPLFAARRVDFSVQWNALLHGKIVGKIRMEQPELNFVDAESESGTQTGEGGAWLQVIQDLFPFRINSAQIQNGTIHFRTFGGKQPLDVYLSKVQGSINNLGNIRGETKPLVATVEATALAMDHARFEYKMTLDPFSYRPTFKLAVRLLGLDVTKINDLARAYGKFDFEDGWFDLVIEATAQEGQLKGYAKPLFRNLKVLHLTEDLEGGNVLQVFWEALVGGVSALLKNQPRDQFGTLIPFSGDLSESTTADILATIGNILRNAFIRAYLPRLEDGGESVDGLEFTPPELHDPVSAGDTPG